MKNIVDAYQIGITAIDDGHVRMLIQIQEMDDLLKSSDDNSRILDCCNRIFSTVLAHYDSEERLMLKHFYPYTESHIGQHMNFIHMLGKLVQLIKNEEYETALSTLNFIRSWKLNHINEADKKYADFINTKPV